MSEATASMPGLTKRRALMLNLSGSAVSNVLPLGGVADNRIDIGRATSWNAGSAQRAWFHLTTT